MIKDLEQLKEFIIWAKKQKVQHFKVDNIEILISDIGMVENSVPVYEDDGLSEMLDSSKTLTEEINPDEDEDLFYSAGPQRN